MERKLVAVMVLDLVGYSRLMAADEAGTLANFAEIWGSVVAPAVAEHRGRIVKRTGDGALVEFASVIEAVEGAAAIQRRSRERNAGIPPEKRLEFRIGVNLGDVLIEEGDLLGEGVNLADRLQAIADPGGICVSRTVYQQVRAKVDLRFEDLGEQRLKNLPDPVRVFRVALDAATTIRPKPPSPAPTAVLQRPAIAVLPFKTIGAEPDQEYFADGITEDIITALSYWRWFPVIARNSTFAYRGAAKPPSTIAEELGARYILQGSVRRAGRRIRISAQFVDAGSGHEVWARHYDGALDDVFAVQDQITSEIVAAIEPQLAAAEQRRALRQRPESLDAWDLSLRALWHLHRPSRDNHAEARRLLAKAVELDPGSSYAQSIVALAAFLEALSGWVKDPRRALASTMEAARRAVALDDKDWLAHALLGIACLWTRRAYEDAEAEENRALELNPSAALSYQFLGCVLEFGGRVEEAIPHLTAVLRLDPLYQSRSLILADLSLCHLLQGRFEEAVAVGERAMLSDPDNARALQRLVAALGHVDPPRAAGAAARLALLQPGFSLGYIDATYPFRMADHREIFVEGLRRAGIRL